MRSKVRSDKKLDDKTYVLTFNTLAGAGGFAKPRSKQQSAGLLLAAFGRPTCSNPTSSSTKKDPQPQLRISFGGSWWIRTTEALSSRFTVCPHWPLGNTPIFTFCVLRRTTCLFYHEGRLLSTVFCVFLQIINRCAFSRENCSLYSIFYPISPHCSKKLEFFSK